MKLNQAGASHFLGLGGPSCIALGVVLSIDVLPVALVWEAAFLAEGSIWALVAERQWWVVVLLLGVPCQAEWMEAMEVIAPIRCDRR